MSEVFNILLPILLLLALGGGLCHWKFLPPEVFRQFNRLVYWIGLPFLIVRVLVQAETDWERALPIITAFNTGCVLSMIAGFFVVWIIGLRKESWGTFIQSGFRGNLAFIGIPVLVYIFQGMGDEDKANEALAIGFLILAPTMLVYNVISVAVLLYSQSHMENWSWHKLFNGISSNPIILSSLLGIGLSAVNFELPVPVGRFMEHVGNLCIPLALMSIGASLIQAKLRGNLRYITLASLHKVLLTPVITWVCGIAVGLDGEAMTYLMVFGSCPTAAVSYVMVTQIGGDENLASGSIAMSTALSFFSLSAVVLLF